MGVSIEQVVLFVNIFLAFIILLCGLIGFIRGTLKSSYYMTAMLLVLLIGWLLMTPVSNKIAYLDLSKLNMVIDGILVKNPMQFISTFIERDYSDYAFLLTEGSQSLQLIEGTVGVATKLLYFILLIISLFTIYYLIFGITWIFVKKPLRRMFDKTSEISLKRKPTFKSRLGGLGIGLTKGLIYTLLIGIIFASVSTIGNSIENITESSTEIAIVCDDNTFTFVELSTNVEEEANNSEYQMIFDIFDSYHETIPSKIFGSIKYGKYDTTFDEVLSDSIFTIKSGDNKIKLRTEIKKVEEILTSDAVQAVMSEGFDIKKLHHLDDEQLKEIVDTLSSLDLVKVVVPVGIEMIAYSDILVKQFGEEFKGIQKIIQENYDELVKLDYSSDVQKIGYAFVNVIDLLGEDIEDLSNIDFFNFDLNTINELFDNLEKMQLLEVIAPVFVNYILNMDFVKEIVTNAGFTMEDLGLTEDVDYVHEMLCIKNIYNKVTELNIKKVNGKIDFSTLNYEKIDGLVDTLFESNIIKNIVPIISTSLLTSYLPSEFASIFTKEKLENINWENEFSPLLAAAVTLINSDILTAENKAEAIVNLDDNTINQLGMYLSQSEILTGNFNEILDVLLKNILNTDEGFVYLDASKGEVWDEKEIVSFFKVIKRLATGISLDMPDEEIDKFSNEITSSKFIKKNLNAIIKLLSSNFNIDLIYLSEEEWTTDEVANTLKALKLTSRLNNNGNIQVSEIFNLEEYELDIIIKSKIISNAIVCELIKYIENENVLDLPEELKNPNCDKWYGLNGELKNLIQSLKIILQDSDSIDVSLILKNEDLYPQFDNEYNSTSKEIDKLLNSIIVEKVFVDYVQTLLGEGETLTNLLNVPKDAKWLKKDVADNNEYDLKTFIESLIVIQSVLDLNEVTNDKIKKMSSNDIEILATGMVTSRIFRGSIAKMFNEIFGAEINDILSNNSLPTVVKDEIKLWWSNNKFNQNDYENVSKNVARTRLIEKLNKVCEMLNK